MMLCTKSTIASLFLVVFAGLHCASSFSSVRHGSHGQLMLSKSTTSPPSQTRTSSTVITHNSISTSTYATISNCWTPQDLTKDNEGFLPIPPNDYIKKYQSNPQLWPVEFFVIVFRHVKSPHQNGKTTTQILVRKSANGTSKYGVGTGVPVTRWMLSLQSPPRGYQVAKPEITFDASNFPEFSTGGEDSRSSWTYSKIDICKDAFHSDSTTDEDDMNIFEDALLQEYASNIRQQLQQDLSQRLQTDKDELSDWDFNVLSTVKSVIDNDNSVAAIQGSVRMSGLFGYTCYNTVDSTASYNQRFVNFDNAPSPTSLAKSTRIYTMFPQMPDPMPSPTSTPQELKEEILSRPRRMQEIGRDPHKDKYGRVYTHISTSNVSNTIHGVYITFDATDLLPGVEDVPPAYDLFGTRPIEREFVSVDDLKVTEEVEVGAGQTQTIIGECDTKDQFISGFIVRQLIRDGVIGLE